MEIILMPMTTEQAAIVTNYKNYEASAVIAKEQQLNQVRILEALQAEKVRQQKVALELAETKKKEFLHESREQDIRRLKANMTTIRDFIASFSDLEKSCEPQYSTLFDELNQFETALIQEIEAEPSMFQWRKPNTAINDLNEMVKAVFDPFVSQEAKDRSIRKFEVNTRNGYLSMETKFAIGFAIVSTAILSVCFFPFLPVSIGVFMGLIIGASIGVPIATGIIGGLSCMFQDDDRDKKISATMSTLKDERKQHYGFFQSKKEVKQLGDEKGFAPVPVFG
jgi:hypothetical protein